MKEEFLQVLNQHKGIIFKMANMYCRDSEDQKDLVQDMIIQLWNSFEKFDGRVQISTWIYRIVLNVSISYYRKSQTRQKHIAPFDQDFLQIEDTSTSENEPQIKLLKQFINELDELNKALMILYLDGNSHEEIAKILNISVSNVGTKISRVKMKLKEKFQKIETP